MPLRAFRLLPVLALAAAAEPDLAPLRAARDALAPAQSGGERLVAVLERAADGQDLVLCLPRRGGPAGASAGAAGWVPAWRAEALNDRFKAEHQNEGGLPEYTRIAVPVEAAGLEWTAQAIAGTASIGLRRDATRDEAMPPGARIWIPATGERHSWYDMFRPVGAQRTRAMRYELSMRPLPGTGLYDLRFQGLAEGVGDIAFRFLSPQRTWDRATGRGWNGGYHLGDASGLRRDGASLRGVFAAQLVPDPWVPKDGRVRRLQVDVSAAIAADGRIAGTWTMADDETVGGALSGWAAAAWTGTYRGAGELGACQGPIIAGMQLLPDAAAAAQPIPAAAGAIEAAYALWRQIRIIDRLRQDPGCHAGELAAEPGLPVPSWASPADPAIAAHIARMVRAAEGLRDPQPLPPARPGGMPGMPAALAGAVPTASGWYHPVAWQVVGPFTATAEMVGPPSRIPDLLPAPGATYPAAQPRKAPAGRKGAAQAAPAMAWTELASPSGRVQPEWERAGGFQGVARRVWYAACTVRADAPRTLAVAIAPPDQGTLTLWWNDRLVWSSPEVDLARTIGGEVHLAVAAAAGANELVVRCRSDRDGGGFRLVLGVDPPPAAPGGHAPVLAGATFRGDGSGRYAGAAPPVAWDVATGANIAWSAAIPDGGSMPVAAGDAVAVMGGDGTLSVFSASTGAPRFSAIVGVPDPDPKAKPVRAGTAPAITADAIFAHGHQGAVAAFDHAGAKRWEVASGLRKAVLYPLRDALLVVGGGFSTGGTAVAGGGGSRSGPGAARDAGHQAIALDPATGAERWRRPLDGAFDPRGTAVLGLRSGDGVRAVLVGSGGTVLDAADGGVLAAGIDGIATGAAVQAAGDDAVYVLEQRRRAAYRLAFDAVGRLTITRLWQTRHEISGFMDQPSFAVAGEGLVAITGKVPEHGPHCPLPMAEMEVRRIADGALVRRIKPVMTQVMRHFDHPVLAGGIAFMTDGGGGFGIAKPATQIAAVQLGGQPRVLAVNAQPAAGDCDPTPCCAGDALFMRGDRTLWAVRAAGAGIAAQAERLANELVSGLDLPAPAAPLREIPATVAEIDPARTPIGPLAAGEAWMVPVPRIDMPWRWLLATGDAPDGAAAAASAAVPRIGDAAPGGAAWRPLPAEHLQIRTPYTLENTYLQGRGQRIIHRLAAIDPAAWSGERGEGVGWLATVVEVPRDQVIALAGGGAGVRFWMDGSAIAPGERLRLAAGRHVLLARVGPEFLIRPPRQAPVDVAAAIAGGALAPVALPATWPTFGPLPMGAPLPAAELLAAEPAALPGADRRTELAMEGGLISLAPLVATPDGKEIFGGEVAISYAAIDLPANGRLFVNAAADWRMAWFLDGESRYSTWESGNGGDPAKVSAHTWSAPVAKGRHVLAVATSTGSKGWSLRAIAGFASDPAAPVHERFPVPGVRAVEDPPPQFRFAAVEHEDPAAANAERVRRIAAVADPLRRIVAELPGTPAAKRAAQLLAALP